jgi:hypothetical protein
MDGIGVCLLQDDARLPEFVVGKIGGDADEWFHIPYCKRPHRFSQSACEV